MPLKEKKCKGTGKALNSGCGKVELIKSYGLCYNCYVDWLLNTPLGNEKLERSRIQGKKRFEKEERSKKRTYKLKNSDWKVKLQDKINEIVRIIDAGLPCLARGHHAKQIHAGHVYARGGNQTIRYNLHNIHRQSAQSNHYQNDDGLLREGLTNEYGQDYMNFISDLRSTKALKFTNDEYYQFYKKACHIANRMRKDGNKYQTPQDRIVKRNNVNIEIGIYRLKHSNYDKR